MPHDLQPRLELYKSPEVLRSQQEVMPSLPAPELLTLLR